MKRRTSTPRTPEDLYERDRDFRFEVDQSELLFRVGELLYDARRKLGLTQQEVARRVGTTASVIRRVEEADDLGHSMGVLQRLASELGLSLDIHFVPKGRTTRRATWQRHLRRTAPTK